MYIGGWICTYIGFINKWRTLLMTQVAPHTDTDTVHIGNALQTNLIY